MRDRRGSPIAQPLGQTMAGAKIRHWRRVHGLSGAELAAQFGVHMRTLYRIETGDRTAPDDVKRAIVAAAICTYDDFFTPADGGDDAQAAA